MAGAATDIVGTAGVDIIPVTLLFNERLKAAVLPGANKLGNDFGDIIARAMSAKIAAALPKAISEGAKAAKSVAVRQGSQTGGAFADSLRVKLEAAFRAMPKLDVKLSDVGVDAQLARLRAKLEDLRNKRVGIDISTADAEARVQELDDQLAILGARSPNVRIRVDTATARAALAEFRSEIATASADPLRIPVRVGSFEHDLIARIEAVQASLPAIEIDADTDPARRDLDRYRAELAAIPTRMRVDANFNATEALAKIQEIRAGLESLKVANNVDVDVRVDAARAESELASISAEVDALSAKDVNIKVDVSAAMAAVKSLAINIAALGAIPLVPVLGAGAGGIVAAFTASAAAVGAFGIAAVPALHDVSAALHAQTAAATQSGNATKNAANVGVAAAQRALQMAAAQQSLASAERSAASSIRSADEQIANAQRAVAQATQQAAEQRVQSLRQVQSAEQDLAHAQRAELDAQTALTQARADAQQQLDDLDDKLRDGALAQTQAALEVQRTRQQLELEQANPNTYSLDLAEAQLAYDQAIQNQSEQAKSYDRLQKTADEQRKAGVEGSDAVKSAAQRLADAQEDAAEKTQALADAQTNVAKTAKKSAEAIADAQRQEADAYRSAADARANAADAIKSAERGIQEARLSASKTTASATTQEDAYRKALNKLTPEARDLFDAIAGPRGLKSAFSDWSKSVQPDVLPLFTRGVNSAKDTLPGLTPLVLAAADGITTLYDDASRELKSPFWLRFKDDIKTSAEPAVIGLGKAFGNVFKGMAGVVDAFLPHIDGVDDAMIRITGRFANWGVNLQGSEGFASFLDYVKEEGPKAAHYIGQILTIVTDVAKDIQPVAEGILSPFLTGLEWMAENMPEVIQLFYALYLGSKLMAIGWGIASVAVGIFNTAMALASLETWSFAGALAATGISELILLIEAAVVVLALGLYELWTNAGWFRASLKSTWSGLGTAVSAVWRYVIKPVFDAFRIAFVTIGDAAVWLWKSILAPTFNAIQLGARYLITAVLTILITPFYIAITQVLAPIVLWLWTHAFKPSLDAIGGAATWLWTKVLKPVFGAIGDYFKSVYKESIKPTFDGFKLAMKGVGDAGSALWKLALKPAYSAISGATNTLWTVGIKPWFDKIKDGVGKVADSFGTAKDGIKTAWDQVSGIAKKPVKFVVDHVYNEGIMPVWNAIAKITGVKTLGKVNTSKWATGGILPGYTPGRDPHKFYSSTAGALELSGGEAILRPEVTRAIGAPFVYAINSIAQRRGVSGVKAALGGSHAYFGGGIVDWLGDKAGHVAGIAKGTYNTVKDLASYAVNPSKIWDELAKSVKNQMAKLGNTDWDKMIAKFPQTLITGLKDKAVSTVKSLVGGSDGSGAILGGGDLYTKWNDTILQALKLVGQPSSYLGITTRRMMQESGGNPTAVNLWDSNAKAGHPSVGLMQIVKGTFERYAGPFLHTGPFAYGVSEDPLAQFYTSMKYALSRYGSLPAAYNRAGGYDDGGWLQPGDWGVYNHTGRPEPVFTAGQWSTLRANIEARNAAPVYAPEINVDVNVGNEKLDSHIDRRIDVHSDQWSTDLGIGRRL